MEVTFVDGRGVFLVRKIDVDPLPNTYKINVPTRKADGHVVIESHKYILGYSQGEHIYFHEDLWTPPVSISATLPIEPPTKLVPVGPIAVDRFLLLVSEHLRKNDERMAAIERRLDDEGAIKPGE